MSRFGWVLFWIVWTLLTIILWQANGCSTATPC